MLRMDFALPHMSGADAAPSPSPATRRPAAAAMPTRLQQQQQQHGHQSSNSSAASALAMPARAAAAVSQELWGSASSRMRTLFAAASDTVQNLDEMLFQRERVSEHGHTKTAHQSTTACAATTSTSASTSKPHHNNNSNNNSNNNNNPLDASAIELEDFTGRPRPALDASSASLALSPVPAAAEQQRFNQLSLQLHSAQACFSMANYIANRHLRRDLHLGRQQLRLLQSTVAEQSDTIDDLNSSVTELEVSNSMLREQTTQLRQSLQANTSLLHASLDRYRIDKMAQDAQLAEQARLLAALQTRQIRKDGLVDSLVGAISMWLVNMTLVDAPLRAVLMFVPRRRLRTWCRQAAKLLLLVTVFKTIRHRAIEAGLHGGIGALAPYLRELLALLPRPSLGSALRLPFYSSSSTTTTPPIPTVTSDSPTTPPATPRHWPLETPNVGIATPSQFSAE